MGEDTKEAFKQTIVSERAECGGIDEPLPLCRNLQPAKPFPLESLPGAIGGAVNEIVEIIQCPLALAAQSCLAALSLSCQAYFDIEIDGRVCPSSEFFLSLGESGERKSATDKAATRSIDRFQKREKERYERERAAFEIKLEAWSKARAKASKSAKSHAEIQIELEKIGSPPEPPLGYVVKTGDFTIEGIYKTLLHGRPSIGIMNDEGGVVVGGHAMNKDNLLKTIAGCCELWDGKPISRSRAGDRETVLYGRRLTFHLLVQPEVAKEFITRPMVQTQGFMGRCLVCYPESNIGKRRYCQKNVLDQPSFKYFDHRLFEIIGKELPLAGNSSDELKPKRLSLARDAKELFVSFHDETEQKMGAGQGYETIKSFGSKMPEHALRLAGLLAAFESDLSEKIGLAHLEAAIPLTEYYASEHLRLNGAVCIDAELSLAQKTVEFLKCFLKERGRDIFCSPDVYQFGSPEVRTAEKARGIVATLQKHGFVIPKGEGVVDGKKRRETFSVNINPS